MLVFTAIVCDSSTLSTVFSENLIFFYVISPSCVLGMCCASSRLIGAPALHSAFFRSSALYLSYLDRSRLIDVVKSCLILDGAILF